MGLSRWKVTNLPSSLLNKEMEGSDKHARVVKLHLQDCYMPYQYHTGTLEKK